jgi:hypothetical protein
MNGNEIKENHSMNQLVNSLAIQSQKNEETNKRLCNAIEQLSLLTGELIKSMGYLQLDLEKNAGVLEVRKKAEKQLKLISSQTADW